VNSDSHIVNRVPDFRINRLHLKPAILIIEDEIDICYLLSSILKQKDIRTVFASSLSEADKIIEHSEEFSFIFLDNHLPDGLGVNHIRHLKKICPLCKIIMITAHDNQTDREKASHEGADYFIGKPFSRELILTAIDKFLA
jgi:two-component system, OmpR family, response regulator